MEQRAFQFRLPMRRLRLAGREYQERTGLLLCDAATGTRWGEASPLPGFSRESLDDVIAAWRTGPPFTHPSLRFAIETLEEANGADDGFSIPVNGLLIGSRADVLESAAAMSSDGFPAVKLKVGPAIGSPEECARLVREMRGSLAPSVLLRLDANRAWSLEEAERFGRRIGDVPIEYCEEPTRSPHDLERFWEATRVPYALDETLRETTDLRPFPNVSAVIVKPMLLGGRQDIVRWQRAGIRMIFSGAFESGVGTARVARLAAEFSPDIPAGLDAYRWLLDDVVTPRLSLGGGRLHILRESIVCWDKLQEVSP